MKRNHLLEMAVAVGMAVMTFPAYAQDADKPFKIALDLSVPPLAFSEPDGKVAGFSYDVAVLIAERLGRPGVEVVDSNFGAIFADLYANRYEMIASTVNITPERAEKMLFSEPVLPAGFAFITKAGEKISSIEDLKGKTIAVNSGSVSDRWVTENAEKLGVQPQRYNQNSDAVQAVVIGRAYAHMGDTPISRYVASQNPRLEVAFTIDTGRQYGFAFRTDDGAFRAKVEAIIECLKIDGSIPAIHKKWLGVEPEPGTASATAYPGNGPEGFAGYEARDTPPSCPK